MKYDAFQKKAIEHINQGHSVIVSAPTGSGKTVIAEHVIQSCLQSNKKVIYTAPIKALSNQKYRDFSKNFPDRVGILTGDVTLNPDAPALIMTTEIFRNKILDEQSNLSDYLWVIFDEIHYLDDYERGSVWEESLIFLPDHMRILGLSATIPNLDNLVQWLQTVHKGPIKIVKETQRPVPLHFFYQCQGEIFDNLNSLKKHGYHSTEHLHLPDKKLPKYIPIKPSSPASLIRYLADNDLFPSIYFSFSRRRCEYLAHDIEKMNFLNDNEKIEIKKLYQELCEKFDLSQNASAYRLQPLIEKGIAYHHAGMLPTLKEVIERLFTTRLLKVIFTTETFALGVNMPARTVILDELRKFYGRFTAALKTRDFYQMAGRAGRRSIDTEGYVFCRINPHYITPNELDKIIFGEPEQVVSRFNTTYATILNLYQKYGEKLYDVYALSFHHFVEQKRTRNHAVDMLRSKVRILKTFGYIQKNRLTEKGLFASKIFGYELMLTEIYNQGALQNLSLEDLGILCLAVVFEPRKGARRPNLRGRVRSIEHMAAAITHPIHKIEKKFRIKPASKPCHFHLTEPFKAWMQGESFETILEYTDADEGEVVRYFRMTIQILRDMLDTQIADEVKPKIKKLIHLINRDVIDAEKQLRN